MKYGALWHQWDGDDADTYHWLPDADTTRFENDPENDPEDEEEEEEDEA